MVDAHKGLLVGDICNTYGKLHVKKLKGKCYWSIGDWDGNEWEEIPQYLYDALIKFEFTLPDWL